MPESKNTIALKIQDQVFTVVSDESPEYMHALEKELNSRMSELMKSSRRISRTEAAVLAALDCLDGQVKAEARYRDLNARFDEYGRVLDNAKKENDELRKLLGK